MTSNHCTPLHPLTEKHFPSAFKQCMLQKTLFTDISSLFQWCPMLACHFLPIGLITMLPCTLGFPIPTFSSKIVCQKLLDAAVHQVFIQFDVISELRRWLQCLMSCFFIFSTGQVVSVEPFVSIPQRPVIYPASLIDLALWMQLRTCACQ